MQALMSRPLTGSGALGTMGRESSVGAEILPGLTTRASVSGGVMRSVSASSEVQLLLKILEEAYSVKTWHGPNLKGSLRGLTAAAAAWRPGPKRHSIWEVAVHAAYWKYVVRRRLLGEKRGSFALKGSKWFVRPLELSEKAWEKDLALLDGEHARLREAVAGLKPTLLSFTPASSKMSNFMLICGIANHDVYHAGQIQLLKRLQKE